MQVTGTGAFIADEHLEVTVTSYLAHRTTRFPTESLEEPCITWIVNAHACARFSVVRSWHTFDTSSQGYGGSGRSNATGTLTTTH
jgi:hypothetical protein